MPRKRELTWQPGSGNRSGRWRKKYPGRSIYLCSTRCKSDLEGYQQALAIWRRKKLEIDSEEAARPKPHQVQYEGVIAEWEQDRLGDSSKRSGRIDSACSPKM